jgi:hypothetical protein
VISRSTELPALEAFYVNSLESVRRVIATLATRWTVADLSLGSWRSHQASTELCAQLELAPPAHRLPERAPATSSIDGGIGSYADQISALVDSENRGDRATITALYEAERLVATALRTPCTFLVITPRFGVAWEREDRLLIQFLVQGVQPPSRVILLVDQDSPQTFGWTVRSRNDRDPPRRASPGGILALVPGVIDVDLAAAIDDDTTVGTSLRLPTGRLLIPPEFRRDPRSVPASEYDALASASRSFGWLQAYAQYFGSLPCGESQLLAEEALSRFAEGGVGVALRLIDRAIGCSREPIERAMHQAQADGLRLSLGRFAEVSEGPGPSNEVPSLLRGFLAQGKGWALTMSGSAAAAEDYLREARRLLASLSENRAYLYLLNISALNRLKLGDLGGALRMEKEIEANLMSTRARDYSLQYVNGINLGRLYRRIDAMDAAETSYRDGFDTTLGARTSGDCLFTNVSMARLHALRHDDGLAFLAWLRACLHWLGNPVPEALARRVATAILEHAPDAEDAPVEAISAALESQLLSFAKAAGLHGSDLAKADPKSGVRPDPPVFVCADRLPVWPETSVDFALGAAGWSLLGMRRPVVPSFRGPSWDRLRNRVYSLVDVIRPFPQLAEAATLIVDDRFGCEVATDTSETLDVCARWRVPRLVFGAQEFDLPHAVHARLEALSHVSAGSAVKEVRLFGRAASVTFKRYLSPKAVFGLEREIVATFPDQPSLQEVAKRLERKWPRDQVVGAVRSLERDRIATLRLPSQVIDAAVGVAALEFINSQ